LQTFSEVSSIANVKFVSKISKHQDYVLIKKGDAESDIGRLGGEQEASFGLYIFF